jgi:hypothetical protein
MRLSTCAATIVAATLIVSTLATPTPDSAASRNLADEIEKRGKKKKGIKYFHEAGCVMILSQAALRCLLGL